MCLLLHYPAAKSCNMYCFSEGAELGDDRSVLMELLGDGCLSKKHLETPIPITTDVSFLFPLYLAFPLPLPWFEEHGWVSLAVLPNICPALLSG